MAFYHAEGLFELLDLNHNDPEEVLQKLDSDAIIKAVEHDPDSAETEYCFSHDRNDICYPLHKAIKLGAPIDVIDILCNMEALAPTLGRKSNALQLALEYKSSRDVVELLLAEEPNLARVKTTVGDTPLHLACENQCPLEIVSLLLSAWPDATQERSDYGYIPLHLAVQCKCSVEIVSLLISAWPDSVQATGMGWTPLHFACRYSASLEVISLLLSTWPDAAKEGDGRGETPLHVACTSRAPLEVVSLLLNSCPDSARVKADNGNTPLRSALDVIPPILKVIMLLLEKWPAATIEKNNYGVRLCDGLGIGPENITQTLICHVSLLVNFDYSSGDVELKDIIHFFLAIKWQYGVSLVLARRPAIYKSMNLPTKIIPDFLAVVRRHSKLKTIWGIIREEQDLFSDF